jgi:hypothetical protein
VTIRPDSIRHIQTVVPTTGPVGTTVTVHTENLPLQARVHVGVGATRTGFEALFEAEQGMWGEVSATVTIPESAPWDRAVVFVAFNAIFAPIGISDPFHVTNAEGLIRRSGRVTTEADGCLTLRDTDDYLYALAGDVGDLRPGDDVVVEGSYSETGPCIDTSTIGVVRLISRGR